MSIKSSKNLAINAVSRNINSSARKLSLVVELIKNMKVSQALDQLAFCRKKAALDVHKCLKSAIANAEHNHGADIDCLFVSTATVGRGMMLKRFMPRAKGRSGAIKKKFSNLYITLAQMQNKEGI